MELKTALTINIGADALLFRAFRGENDDTGHLAAIVSFRAVAGDLGPQTFGFFVLERDLSSGGAEERKTGWRISTTVFARRNHLPRESDDFGLYEKPGYFETCLDSPFCLGWFATWKMRRVKEVALTVTGGPDGEETWSIRTNTRSRLPFECFNNGNVVGMLRREPNGVLYYGERDERDEL